ncbi:MAG: hypothetical protein H7A21_20715 [Spirochaetales bacterium]|nr:hypothetical protein [Spirochaetales bacterium]
MDSGGKLKNPFDVGRTEMQYHSPPKARSAERLWLPLLAGPAAGTLIGGFSGALAAGLIGLFRFLVDGEFEVAALGGLAGAICGLLLGGPTGFALALLRVIRSGLNRAALLRSGSIFGGAFAGLLGILAAAVVNEGQSTWQAACIYAAGPAAAAAVGAIGGRLLAKLIDWLAAERAPTNALLS